LDGTLKVENVSDWVEDANDSGILYHDGLKIRGVLKTAAPGGKASRGWLLPTALAKALRVRTILPIRLIDLSAF
jgi:hypothetical protein